MKALLLGTLAIAGIAMTTPAVAQVYFGAGPGGIGVGVGHSGYYGGYRHGYRNYGYDNGYRNYGYDRGYHCRHRLIETPHGLVRTNRCW
jgi:hypothetical protein